MTDFQPVPIKPTISFDLLDQIDIRVGTIERVEEVPKSDKLLRLIVNFGDHTRTILSGMKQERANPQEIVGRQALFVVNLEPKKIMGEVSELDFAPSSSIAQGRDKRIEKGFGKF